MAFVWRHKGALAVGSVLAAFLADPGPFIGGTIWVVLTKRLLAGSPNGQSIAFSIFGVLVLATMLYRPSGLAGLGRDAWRALRRKKASA